MNQEILHFGYVGLRASGSGTLLLYLRSLDNIRSSQLPSITLASPTNIEPKVIANFVEQRAQLEIRTEGLNEVFNISRIVIGTKAIFTEKPR